MRVWLCCFGVLLALAAPVRADQTDDVDAEMIEAALAENRLTAAYARASRYAERRPDDLRARRLAAAAATATMRIDEAEAHVAAALALAPEDAALHALTAHLQVLRGDLVRAREHAARALASDPDEPAAAGVVEYLDTIDAARAHRGATLAGAAASPEAFVDGVIRRALAGASALELRTAFDPEIATFVDGVLEGARAQAALGAELVGWVVEPARTIAQGRAVVDLRLVSHARITRESLDAAITMGRLSIAGGRGDVFGISMIDGLEERDRPAAIDRMVGLSGYTVAPVSVEVAGAAGAYRVIDVTIGGLSARSFDAEADAAGDAERAERRAAHGAKQKVVLVVLVGMLLASFVWFLWSSSPSGRRRRRRLG